ncbi:DNA cytosine methyltransferase [Pedobacter mucosus]|uniref:DNA cytosine methyltransferase n=1 Tax=Pedobacter mucosus TaxID=2895286 RepID=UPI001EE40D59|nr:DNA cytosine methyltransferase [Pedobacter mucosus]UKT65057.1 DNA cytosine methyltransferase [Pedobacter mucosus]
MKSKKLKHIELFAGCGGMSLGLEAAGFQLFFANELSPMAGETFAYNILDEDLQEKVSENISAKNVKWIRSNFSKSMLSERLRENPFKASEGKFTDINNLQDIKGNLLVGDIDKLLEFLDNNPEVVSEIQKEKIDLLSGGPPCQSFSLAGKREKDNHKNLLPLSFARIAGLVKPKVILLENVKGITSPFTEDGEKHYAWLEVSKAFVLQGYVPVCMMLNSKYFGVAQNRPRFILFAFRFDVFTKIKAIYSDNVLLEKSADFFEKVTQNRETLSNIKEESFKYFDIEDFPKLFNGEILPKLTRTAGKFVSAIEAIGDIRRTGVNYRLDKITNGYGSMLNDTFRKESVQGSEIKNHDPREHTFSVKARFRFYQVINEFQNGLRRSAIDLFTGRDVSEEKLERLFEEFSKYNLYFKDNQGEHYRRPKNIHEVDLLIKSIPTKKHSQRALHEFEPAPAQLTIPDDICHYHMETLRTMTVREMARFQSFPDWFEFRSKVTTGGISRKFEVPQYTQVGNAVPPLLAKSLGETIKRLLTRIK